MPVLAPSGFVLLEEDKKNIWLTTKAKAKSEINAKANAVARAMSGTNHQDILSNLTFPKKRKWSSDRNRKLQQGEAPSRAFTRHTSKMGHSWFQPTLLWMLNGDVCQQSSFSAWRVAHHIIHIQIAPPLNKSGLPSTISDCWSYVLQTLKHPLRSQAWEPRQNPVASTGPKACLRIMQPSYSVAAFGAGLWWRPHKCRSKSRLRAACSEGEAGDIGWRPLWN